MSPSDALHDDRIVAHGLLGFGLEFGDNKLRLTNLYIRDTLKKARLGIGTRATSGSAEVSYAPMRPIGISRRISCRR